MDQPLTLRDEADQTRDMSSRSISLRAATLNEADRSVEAVLSTDQPVAVMDWNRYEVIDEVLLADGGDYPRQMPLLECHARYSLDNVLGSVRDIRRDGNNWVGRLFFAKDNERADQAWDLVRQGHVTDVSIGYRSTKFTDIPAGQSGAVNGKTYTATGERALRVTTAYSAKEGSLVPIGADSKAKVRGEGTLPAPPTTAPAGPGKGVSMNPLLRKYLESLGLRADANEAAAQAFLDALGGTQRAIADEVVAGKIKTDADLAARTAPASAAPATAPAAHAAGTVQTPDQIRAEGSRLERERITAIRGHAGNDVPAEMVERAITESWTAERAATAFLSHIRASRSPSAGAAPGAITGGHERDCTRASLGLALAMRSGLRGDAQIQRAVGRMRVTETWQNLAQRADRFNDMSLVDVCREALRMDGRDVPHSRDEMIRAAVSGGSLTQIFTTSVNAMLLMAYDEEPDSTNWVAETDVADFKTNTDIRFNANATLEKVGRGGEANDATADDSAETYKIARYGKKFSVDEQDIIDDSMNAISTMPMEFGQASRRLRPDLVYSLILANPTMADGGTVYNSTALTTGGGHANYASDATTAVGGPLAAGTLQLAITKMRQQYRLSGKNKIPLNIVPQFLLVPPELEFTARILVRSAERVTGQDSGTFNPLQGIVTPVVETRLGTVGVVDPSTGTSYTGTAVNYFLAARPGLHVKVAYRRGTGRAPQVRSYVLDKGRWGIGWDINLDIGAKFTEFRGFFAAKGST
jgi:hypothetical protein